MANRKKGGSEMKLTATKIRLKRLEKRITAKDFAKKIGVSTMSLYNYENGVKFPRPKIIGKIAMVLDCDIKELID